ncbi:trehalose-6-phosphate synthase [Roseibacterium sp. SDUM158017]|uniref:alpha,alpha-trehalose-phosphate synthase (UDP-forming) n=1 Tax=Roseicyclus salinarum TaxID=3036773 RepID=UPI002414F9B9|nr:trehalose-6-phosphate synthase [Roseibacterium sp. SDUM158017]MDG4650496.1 trehalose-6-phosphate synthase [Roseibacterium sp. SDUM158017]
MTGRLVVVSNRIPTEAAPSGGLVVALHECLSEQGGLWVGSAPDTVEVPSQALKELEEGGAGSYRRMTFDVTEAEREGYYLGYANGVLWPLFHRRTDLIDVEDAHAVAYLEVNARVARLLSAELRPDDVVWIHDYHFLPLACELRGLGVRNRIGFFLHTPFPQAADLPALPQREAFHDWVASHDLIGLQTERDVAALLEVFRSDPETEVLLNGRMRRRGATFSVGSFPIGIDAGEFETLARENAIADDDLALGRGQKLVLGVDRLDYSKGLVNRFEAFGAYLDMREADGERATFIQIAPPSRSALFAYQEIREELETMSGHVNGTHAELDWTPIRYICRPVPRPRVAGLMRRADVCLVTPLADGMNLVAKEYVAAQEPDDPGVLILSHFAGAAEQMRAALRVNPYDIGEMARAIRDAVSMPPDERRARHAELLDGVRRQGISWWTGNFLDRLQSVPRREHWGECAERMG